MVEKKESWTSFSERGINSHLKRLACKKLTESRSKGLLAERELGSSNRLNLWEGER